MQKFKQTVKVGVVSSHSPKDLVFGHPMDSIFLNICSGIMNGSYEIQSDKENVFLITDKVGQEIITFSGSTRQKCVLSLINNLSERGVEVIDQIWVKYEHGCKVGKAGAHAKHRGKYELKLLIFDIAKTQWLTNEMNHIKFTEYLLDKCSQITVAILELKEFEPIDKKIEKIQNENQAYEMINYALSKKIITIKWIKETLKEFAIDVVDRPDLVLGMTEYSMAQLRRD